MSESIARVGKKQKPGFPGLIRVLKPGSDYSEIDLSSDDDQRDRLMLSRLIFGAGTIGEVENA